MNCYRGVLMLSLLWLPLFDSAAQVQPPSLAFEAVIPGDDFENDDPALSGGLFTNDRAALRERTARLQERLGSAQAREQLRREVRARLEQTDPDLMQALLIDAAAEQALLDLLARHEVEKQAMFLARVSMLQNDGLPGGDSVSDDVQLEELRRLLGPEGLQRYFRYQRTRLQRLDAATLDSRLPQADRLRADQRQRLITLLQELQLRFVHRSMFLRSYGAADIIERHGSPPRDEAQRQQRAKLFDLEANERVLRSREAMANALLERVPQFLTPAQVGVYARWEADKLTRRREHVSKLRREAGLSPEIPDAIEEMLAANQEVAGSVRLELEFRSTGRAVDSVSLAGVTGQAMPFTINQELSAEATATRFANGEVFVLLRWFENGQAFDLPLAITAVTAAIPVGSRLVGARRGQSGATLHGTKDHDISVELRAVWRAPGRATQAL